MKRFYLFLVAAAVAAGCTKNTVVYEEFSPIGFTPVSGAGTKAYGPVEGVAYPVDEAFKVFAFHSLKDAGLAWDAFYEAGSTSVYINGGRFAKEASGTSWIGDPEVYYWPKQGSLMFAGYSPAEGFTGTASYDATAAAPQMKVTGFVQGGYAATDGTGTVPEGYSMVDLMWFNVNDQASVSANNGADGSAVGVQFHHALAWLTFNFKSSTENEFYITGATLKGIRTSGDFTGSYADGAVKAEWATKAEGAADYVLYTSAAGGDLLSAEAKVADDLLVLPYDFTSDATYVLEVKFKQGGTDQLEQTSEIALNSSATKQWLAGKHYTYNIDINAEPIRLDPSVDDWTEETVSL